MKRIGVVITTISDGDFLKKFNAAIHYSEQELEIRFYIVGDLNTPPACRAQCESMSERGAWCKYLTTEEQEIFLKDIGFPTHYIPFRSDNRRNVGYLKAFEEDCEVIISMDDDNFPVDEKFFLRHSITGETVNALPLESGSNWVNPLVFLRSTTISGEVLTVYPRGFPYSKRWIGNSFRPGDTGITGTVGVNVGLWTGDPDIDAITRLTTLCSTSVDGVWQPEQELLYTLQPWQRMPINSQNTAITREAVLAYYFVKMGYRINNIVMDRFGDIFSGYFLELCNQAVGNIITVGNPLVFQDRNEHDLFKDLLVELPGILIIEDLAPFLEASLPPANNYGDAYLSLIESLQQFVGSQSRSGLWTKENLLFIEETTTVMAAWVDACAVIK